MYLTNILYIILIYLESLFLCYDGIMEKELLVLDLHPFFADGKKIAEELGKALRRAEEEGAAKVEVIPGKGSGDLRRSVWRFLDRPEIKKKYKRIVSDERNRGHFFIEMF